MRLLDRGREAVVTVEGWGRGLEFCPRPGGVWITPFRVPMMPLMAAWPPCRAPIRPLTPMPGRVGLALGCRVTPLTCCCCWGGLWATEGGVEREEVLLPLLWPPDRRSYMRFGVFRGGGWQKRKATEEAFRKSIPKKSKNEYRNTKTSLP